MIPLELKTLICKQRADPAAFHQSTCVSAKCLRVEKLWLNSAWGTSADITALPPLFVSHSDFSFVLIFTFWLSVYALIWAMFSPYSLNFGWAALTCAEKRLFFLLDNFSSDAFHLQKKPHKSKYLKKKQTTKNLLKSLKVEKSFQNVWLFDSLYDQLPWFHKTSISKETAK